MDIYLFTGYNRCDLVNKFAEYSYNIRAVIVPKNEKYLSKMHDLLYMCIRQGIPILNASNLMADPEFQVNANTSVLYSSGYPLILQSDLFSMFKYAVNCHPTLLPKYRGKYLEYILLNDESYSGTTIHHIDEGCDSGPIILQKRYKVELTDNVHTLLKKSYAAELVLLDTLLASPNTLDRGIRQEEGESSTYLKQRTPEDSEVSGNLNLIDAYKKSRAFNNDLYPGFFRHEGFKVIFKMHIIDERFDVYGVED